MAKRAKSKLGRPKSKLRYKGDARAQAGLILPSSALRLGRSYSAAAFVPGRALSITADYARPLHSKPGRADAAPSVAPPELLSLTLG
jgi:hypothetical protein